MIARLSAWLVSVIVLLTPVQVIAHETRPRSILVFDQSDMRGPFYCLRVNDDPTQLQVIMT